MRALCVYCGSSSGDNPAFSDAAEGLAEALVARQLGLVYGGARNGLMGTLADRVLALGGQARGVMPRSLIAWEQAHHQLTELLEVDTMHQRKQTMMELADGFIALPGGIGTLEEIFEMISWAQLGVHFKPCAFLNADGYYDALFAFLDHSVARGLMRPQTREMILIDDQPASLVERLLAYRSPVSHRWLEPEKT